MDSFTFNKIAGALLFTVLCVLTLNIAAEAIFTPAKPAKPGYEIEVKEAAKAEAPGAAAAAAEPIEVRLAGADVDRGATAAKVCAACHTFEKGGPNKLGPNLWNILGRAKASAAGFNFSAAMKAKGGNWGFAELDKFIANPKGDVPGTAMAFAGVTRDGQRADIVAYLRTLADKPVDLPKAAAK